MKGHRVFIIAIAVFCIAVAGFIFWQERVVWFGEEVVLATRPVDPRDLFRGEYVILRYEIERSELVAQLMQDRQISQVDGEAVYVRLEADALGVHQVAEVSITKPDFADGLWLQGEKRGGSVRFPMLEQYFVAEGAGGPIERMDDLHVGVAVYKGQGRVVGLKDGALNHINAADYIENK